MKSFLTLIRSLWLVALLVLFGLGLMATASGMRALAIAYDEHAQPTIVYDAPSASVIGYDAAREQVENETRNGTTGNLVILAKSAGFVAAKSALPELRISAGKYPDLAENILNAQRAGHPDVLTHGGEAVVNANRNAALHQPYRDFVPNIGRGLSRDEYPFASSLQGGAGSWVGHIPVSQQNAQGALIKNFINANNIAPGSQYRVVITP